MFSILFINFKNSQIIFVYLYKVFYECNRYNNYLKLIGKCMCYIYLNM